MEKLLNVTDIDHLPPLQQQRTSSGWLFIVTVFHLKSAEWNRVPETKATDPEHGGGGWGVGVVVGGANAVSP